MSASSDTAEAKYALVTGATRGIGAAIAQRLERDGFNVIGTATTDAGAQKISAALQRGKGVCLRVDSDESVDTLMATLKADKQLPQILVNNAGITKDNLLMRMKPDEWNDIINTNLTSLYRMCKPLLRSMLKARWGRIINLSSVVGRMGNPGQTNYVSSKAAIEGFTRSLAIEIGYRGITVNAIAPGFIETDMTNELNEEQTNAMLERIPVGHLGSCDDIAGAVAFLASDDAAYITGATLPVNGGLHMI